MYYYVMACETGREERNAKLLRRTVSRLRPTCILETYIPARESKELCAKTWTLVNRPILPGYVIISSSEMLWEIQKEIFLMSETCYGLLRNVDRTFELKGSDRQFAIWIEDNKGLIKASQVILDYRGLTPDDRITVVSGPMREMRGRIVSIYKGTRVTVEMEFLGEVRRVTLPIEVVKKIDAKGEEEKKDS